MPDMHGDLWQESKAEFSLLFVYETSISKWSHSRCGFFFYLKIFKNQQVLKYVRLHCLFNQNRTEGCLCDFPNEKDTQTLFTRICIWEHYKSKPTFITSYTNANCDWLTVYEVFPWIISLMLKFEHACTQLSSETTMKIIDMLMSKQWGTRYLWSISGRGMLFSMKIYETRSWPVSMETRGALVDRATLDGPSADAGQEDEIALILPFACLSSNRNHPRVILGWPS